MHQVPVYILAGGRSSRFGSDKARAEIAGKPLIVHVAESLREFDHVLAVADCPRKYDDLGVTTIADSQPGLGPIGGLATAVRHARHEWLFVAACDQLDVEPAWLRELWAQRDAASALAFRTDRWQPMPSLWRRDALPIVEQQIAAERLALHELLDRVDARAVLPPANWPPRPSINTPDDLSHWTRASSDADHTTP